MSGARRGRPRKYDPDVALGRALDAFWLNGYAGTSLDDLAEATDMNRPSLYAAFGDKKSMYLKSLDRFTNAVRSRLVGAVPDDASLAEAVFTIYLGAIDTYLADPEKPLGCFAMCTAPAEAARDPDVRAALARVIDELDGGFTARFERAKRSGELSDDTDPAALATLATATLQSIAIRSRGGTPRKKLEAFARSATRVICGVEPPPPRRRGGKRTAP